MTLCDTYTIILHKTYLLDNQETNSTSQPDQWITCFDKNRPLVYTQWQVKIRVLV